jgi:hypothetical protein
VKKSWIIAALIGALLALELVLRAFDDSAPTPEPPAPVDTEPAEKAASPEIAKPAAPDVQPGALAPSDNLPDVEPGGLPDLNKEYLDPSACQGFFDNIEKKGGSGYTKEDVAYLKSVQDAEIYASLTKLVTEFVTCKAVERQDFNACTDIKKLVPPGQTVSCGQVFMLFIPLRAHFIMHMKPDAFSDLYEDLPKNVFDWMLSLMRLLDAQDAAGCDRLSTDPMILYACQTAAGMHANPPSDPGLLDAYFVIQALRTSQMSYLSQVHPGQAIDLVNVLLGKKGVCESAIKSVGYAFCETKRKRPPVNDPALETGINPPVGAPPSTGNAPAAAPRP